MLLNGFTDFLSQFMVVFIVLLLAGILFLISYLKKNVLGKYRDPDEDHYQTPEEILQDELDTLLVTERYDPEAYKKKEKVNDYDDDDFDYDNQKPVEDSDEFVVNDTNSNYLNDEEK